MFDDQTYIRKITYELDTTFMFSFAQTFHKDLRFIRGKRHYYCDCEFTRKCHKRVGPGALE